MRLDEHLPDDSFLGRECRFLFGTDCHARRCSHMPNIRLHLPAALRDHDMRAACTGVEHIMRAGDLLSSLSPEALECVRDSCGEYNKGRKGSEHDFKAAWVDIV